MVFIGGLLVWVVLGVVGAIVARIIYRAEGVETWLTFTFAFFGAMIGGMLGTSPYIHHDPAPLRLGGLLGAALGATLFATMYHFIARKVV